jgi:hypothetical protein
MGSGPRQKFIFKCVSEIRFFLTLVGIGQIFKLVSGDSLFPPRSRTLFAEGVSRNVRFSTLFKVQGQMKVAGQGSRRDRFPQVYVQTRVRICRCQTLVFGAMKKNLLILSQGCLLAAYKVWGQKIYFAVVAGLAFFDASVCQRE